eukprot:scaffold5173_cov125-Isochrysis_galbana.AAC.12
MDARGLHLTLGTRRLGRAQSSPAQTLALSGARLFPLKRRIRNKPSTNGWRPAQPQRWSRPTIPTHQATVTCIHTNWTCGESRAPPLSPLPLFKLT